MRGPDPELTEQMVLRLQLVGANPDPQVTGLDELPGKSHYFLGNDPKDWHTNVPTYARVQYKDIYPGIDLIYYGNQRQLEYDFVVAPGANPGVIKLAFDGLAPSPLAGEGQDGGRSGSPLRIDDNGDLILHTEGDEIRLHKPRIYQEINGVKQPIPGGYILLKPRTSNLEPQQVSFQVSAYDTTKPLIIDPTLSYSTYLGGSGNDNGHSIAVDSSGNAYITGFTASTNFPTASPLQTAFGGGPYDAFVTKLNAAGTALVYSTYLGGSGNDNGHSIAVDSSGNAYVTGSTQSTNFPTASPIQATHGGSEDAFVTKLNPTGSALTYSTYLGGINSDAGFGIAVDSSGNAYVTGRTASTNFPTASPLQATNGGGTYDTFVTKLNAAGSALLYSTYLGGSGDDEPTGDIAVDSSGNAYVSGYTDSTNFPTASPLQAAYGGGQFDAFVTKLNAAGSALLYSTYLGGSGLDYTEHIVVDTSGNTYMIGHTASANFPTASPIQAAFGGVQDAFVAKLNAAGSALIYSTYLGGSGDDVGLGIAVDTSGNAYVAGYTSSTNFPTASPFQAANGGGQDVFVTKVNAAGSALVYSTYLGGSGNDTGTDIATDSSGNAYVAGYTASTNFPTASPLQAANGGGNDAFVAKIVEEPNPALSVTPTSLDFGSVTVGSTKDLTFTVTNSGGGTLTGSVTTTSPYSIVSGSSFSLTASQSQTVTVRFSPTSSGTFLGNASVSSNGGSASVSFSGTGVSCTYSISPTSQTFSASGGTGSVSVTASSGCSWTAVSNVSWITITSGSSGSGNGTVSYSVEAYTGTSSRTGTLTIAGQTFTVTQSPPDPVPSVTPTSLAFGEVTVGSTKDLTFTVTNSGGGTLTGSVTTSSPYSIVSGSSFSLGAGASQTVTVRFSPTSSGTFLGNASVSSNGGNTSVTLSGTGVDCTYSLSPTSQTFSVSSGTGSVSVTASSSSCSWTAVSNATWITITSGSSGTGSGTVSYSVAANDSTSSRTGTMTIAGQTFTVTQEGTTVCTYSISPTSQSFGSSGGTGSVSVTASNSSCSWTAVSNDSWITITSGSSGSGNGTVSYSVAANESTSSRTGTLTIAGQTFTVTQDGTCTYSLSSTSQSFSASGGTGSVGVTVTGTNCSWTAVSNASWVTITSGSTGSGSGTVSYSVVANSDASQRTGTLTIAGQTFTVTQAGVSCTYSISPTSQSFSSSGGTGSVSVTASSSSCSWTATSNASWITITSGSSGSGSGTVSYTVAANTSTSSRTGTLTIAGQTFTVIQEECFYSIFPTSQSFGANGGTESVSVSTSSGCNWTAVSNVSWTTITSGSSGSGNGTVSYSVATNTSSSSRTGTLTIAGQTFTVTQGGSEPQLYVTSTTLDFGSVQVGSSKNLPFDVQNIGGGTLTGTVSTSAVGFSIVSGSSFTLTAGATQTVTVRFSPPEGGTFSGTVTVSSNGGGESVTVKGVGEEGPEPILTVTPSTLDFGRVRVGKSKDLSFTVQNTGEGTLAGTATATDPFSVVANSSFTLDAGEMVLVTVRFSPPTKGPFTGTVEFSSNGGDESATVMGRGWQLPFGLSEEVVPVEIDIHPAGGAEGIDCQGAGAIEVRVFDVGGLPSPIVVEGLTLEGSGPPQSWASADADGDEAEDDLVVHFGVEGVRDEVCQEGVTSFTLRGELEDGTPIAGLDEVTIVRGR